jgi:7-cyano-7-deazaguanine tRNA-ribosyltransferase
MNFEIMAKDAMGRIGKLRTPSGTVETPALMPVINPNIKFISAKEMKKMGAEILITNSYIIYRNENLRERAIEKGIHSLIESDLPVMTDSGSYQLMVYGEVEVKNSTIVEFQNLIKSDVVVPLDIPTPPNVSRERAKKDLEETLLREMEAVKLHRKIGGERLIAAPIQGSTFPDLRGFGARKAAELNADFYPIGGVVPLLDEYRFSEVVDVILAVKSVLPPSAPIHLFGAGHPMIFALAVALGCDFFDSAAYALYAKDDRYLTVNGTKRLEELHYFPCSCPVCSKFTPEELYGLPKDEKQIELARHNLWVSFQEIRTIKQAIRERNLFELVEMRIRGHTNLVAAWRRIKEYVDLFELYDPSAKEGFFYTGIESCYRPAILRHQKKILNVSLEGDSFVISAFQDDDAEFRLMPLFGVVAGDFYPAGHAEVLPIDCTEEEAIEEGIKCLINFLIGNKDKNFELRLTKGWIDFVKRKGIEIPENAKIKYG